MTLTAEQILSLAPDASSAKAGGQLASPGKWGNLGRAQSAVWGECQGSGKDPYRTQIDLSEPAFKCSCPSRKFPCKHGLGLYLLLASHDQLFAAAGAPGWVSDWLQSRQQRSEKKRESVAEKAAASTPEQAATLAASAQKREDKREAKVARGIEELQTWLQDLAREGVSSLRSRGPAFWEGMAARMVDAQASGLAARLRRASGICFQTTVPDWENQLARELASVYLLTLAAQRQPLLAAGLQQDVRSMVGWSVGQDEVLQQDGVTDRWQVLAQRSSDDERVRSRATWLRGAASGRWALVLDYAVGTKGFETVLTTGTEFEGEMAYYAGALPVRALIKRRADLAPLHTEVVAALPPAQLLADYTEALAANPFLERYPMAIGAALPRYDNAAPVLQCEDAALPLDPSFKWRWQLLALSGASPVTVIGEWDGYQLMPLSVIADGHLHNFESDFPE